MHQTLCIGLPVLSVELVHITFDIFSIRQQAAELITAIRVIGLKRHRYLLLLSSIVIVFSYKRAGDRHDHFAIQVFLYSRRI